MKRELEELNNKYKEACMEDTKRDLVLKLERFIDNDTIPVIGDEYIMYWRKNKKCGFHLVR